MPAATTIHAYDYATPVHCVRAATATVVPAREGHPAHTLTIRGGSFFCELSTLLGNVGKCVHSESSGFSWIVFRGTSPQGHWSIVLTAEA